MSRREAQRENGAEDITVNDFLYLSKTFQRISTLAASDGSWFNYTDRFSRDMRYLSILFLPKSLIGFS